MPKPIKRQRWSNIDVFGLLRGLGIWDSQYKTLQYVRRPFDTSLTVKDKILRLNDNQPSLTQQGLLNGLCNEFGFERRSGFLKYIEIGASKMQKFTLPKYLSMYEAICVTYQAITEIENDDDREMTEEIYKVYSQRVISQTGIHDRLEELPDKYVWFVRARKQAENMNISVKIYIAAQFEGLDFTKGIPHPTQLVGPKATERVIRYCYEHDIKIKK